MTSGLHSLKFGDVAIGQALALFQAGYAGLIATNFLILKFGEFNMAGLLASIREDETCSVVKSAICVVSSVLKLHQRFEASSPTF